MTSRLDLTRLPDDCGRLLKGISQADLHEVFVKAQEEQFPGLFDPNLEMMDSSSSAKGYGNYTIFAPSWHTNEWCPLITPDTVLSLREGGKLLSVGAGPAYLEKLLVARFGVERSAISITDLPSAELRDEFSTYRFDMHQEWPELGESFDWIIFPESAFINLVFDDEPQFIDGRVSQPAKEQGLYTLAARALSNTRPGGTVKIGLQGTHEPVVNAVVDRLKRNGFEADALSDSLLTAKQPDDINSP